MDGSSQGKRWAKLASWVRCFASSSPGRNSSSDASISQQGGATTSTKSLQQSSVGSGQSQTQPRRDGRGMERPDRSRDGILPTTMSRENLSRVERLKAIECHRPSIDSVLFKACQNSSANPRAGDHQPTDVSSRPSERVISTAAEPSCQVSQEKWENLDRNQTELPGYEMGISRHSKSLTVPDLYDDGKSVEYEPLRCPKCKWTLLSRPLSSPNVPIISVTGPEGVVRYPYDHTYHASSWENDDDDDSDIWD
ncbi:hypothetical protein F4677DRAFT_212567 [Hypoxylon crocopeplum]|nr:hypothetical protein F4677DRAFT_212567 [Hypoxylon crocopeplum]